jgi:hypothetical protein
MVDFVLRYPEKLTSADGLRSYTFPTDDLEYEPVQGFRVADAPAVGADYAHDFLGFARWAKDVGEEAVRFSLWGDDAAAMLAAFDAALQQLINIGRGKLFTTDQAGTRRWCWAKLSERPAYSVSPDVLFKLPIALRFRRYSDWFAEAATTGSVTVASSPYQWVITNPGNARVTTAVFRLRANSASGFTNRRLENLANAQRVDSSRDAVSASSELKLDCERFQVLWSNDDGTNYSDDYANVTLPAAQVSLLDLEPGDNLIKYTDGAAPNLAIEWSFFAQYH